MDYTSRGDTDFSSAAFTISARGSDEDSVELFRRVEDKFLLPRTQLSKVLDLLEHELEPCYLEPGTKFNAIESVYFDSSSLQIFREHFQNETKFKIRLRRYGPNGVWPDASEPVHLEMKTKSSGVCQKFRLKVESDATSALLTGRPIPGTFLAKKKKAKVVEKTAIVNGAITRFKMRPQLRVVYERKAFEKNGLRVTIDDRIQAEVLNNVDANDRKQIMNSEFFKRAEVMRERFKKGDYVVVEVKHTGTMPEWLAHALTGFGAEKVSFSKYCFSIVNHLLEK